MICHTADYANWHTEGQVPNDTLPRKARPSLDCGMASDFRNALIWHMEENGTSVADLVSGTGVSRDVINKLKARENSSTTVENAMLIASYFGKTVNEFIARNESTTASRTAAMIGLLQPEEQRLLKAQIHGLLSQRDPE